MEQRTMLLVSVDGLKLEVPDDGVCREFRRAYTPIRPPMLMPVNFFEDPAVQSLCTRTYRYDHTEYGRPEGMNRRVFLEVPDTPRTEYALATPEPVKNENSYYLYPGYQDDMEELGVKPLPFDHCGKFTRNDGADNFAVYFDGEDLRMSAPGLHGEVNVDIDELLNDMLDMLIEREEKLHPKTELRGSFEVRKKLEVKGYSMYEAVTKDHHWYATTVDHVPEPPDYQSRSKLLAHPRLTKIDNLKGRLAATMRVRDGYGDQAELLRGQGKFMEQAYNLSKQKEYTRLVDELLMEIEMEEKG